VPSLTQFDVLPAEQNQSQTQTHRHGYPSTSRAGLCLNGIGGALPLMKIARLTVVSIGI
jgi:hypothetical protein